MGEYFYGPRSDELGREQPPPQLPGPDAGAPAAATARGAIATASRSQRGLQRRQSSFLNAATTTAASRRRRRLRKSSSLNAATSGVVPGTRRLRPEGGAAKGEERKSGEGNAGDGDDDYDDISSSDTDWSDDDVEEGGGEGRRRPPPRAFSWVSPVAECREHSTSAWLHFPHVELVVLFFAFEGAVASQVSALREGGCPSVMITATAALVSGANRHPRWTRCAHCREWLTGA